MIHYRKILELHDEGISLRGIASSTGHSRQKVTEIIDLSKKKGKRLVNLEIMRLIFYVIIYRKSGSKLNYQIHLTTLQKDDCHLQ
jgi:hypothetical protein